MAAKHSFVYVFGDSFDIPGIVYQTSAGVAKDITGYTADMKIRSKADGAELLHLFIGNGLSIPTPTDGTTVIAATPTVMKAGSLVNEDVIHDYDLQIRSSDGSILVTLIKGDFVVEKEATDVDS